MVSLLPTKFHEILFNSFRGVALTNCVTDRTKTIPVCLPPKRGGRHKYNHGHFMAVKSGLNSGYIQEMKYIHVYLCKLKKNTANVQIWM